MSAEDAAEYAGSKGVQDDARPQRLRNIGNVPINEFVNI